MLNTNSQISIANHDVLPVHEQLLVFSRSDFDEYKWHEAARIVNDQGDRVLNREGQILYDIFCWKRFDLSFSSE